MKLFAGALISILSLLVQTVNADQFEAGQLEIDQGNYQKGYEILEPLAQQNNAEAQYIIGRVLAEQLISEAKPEQGVVWLKKATENRHFKAAETLGRMYLSGFGAPLDTDKGAYYLSLADEFRPEDEPEQECD